MLATENDLHWPIRPHAIFQRFAYVGPYFIDPALSEAADDYMLLSAIEKADVVFVYLANEKDNTRVGIELGYAASVHKPIWISALTIAPAGPRPPHANLTPRRPP
jgi:hypothetical protein